MNRESIVELNAIEKSAQERPEVLQLRLHHLMREKKWAGALRVSRKLCRVAPHCTAGYLHAGFCLHELGKTLQAKKLLLKGPRSRSCAIQFITTTWAVTTRFWATRNRPRSTC